MERSTGAVSLLHAVTDAQGHTTFELALEGGAGTLPAGSGVAVGQLVGAGFDEILVSSPDGYLAREPRPDTGASGGSAGFAELSVDLSGLEPFAGGAPRFYSAPSRDGLLLGPETDAGGGGPPCGPPSGGPLDPPAGALRGYCWDADHEDGAATEPTRGRPT